jgi:hypothetical protein
MKVNDDKSYWPKSYEELKKYKSRCELQAKIIVSEDKNGGSSQHVAKNEKANLHKVYQYLLDGDIIPHGKGSTRADFLLIDETAGTARIIELKARNFDKALNQVQITDQQLKPIFRERGLNVLWRIVYTSRTHNIPTNRDHKNRKSLKQKYPQLEYKDRKMVEQL